VQRKLRISKPARLNWSRPLPRPLVIPGVMELTTLADVRELIKHLPKGHRERSTWRHVAACLDEAVLGEVDTIDVAVPLQMVLSMEGVECRPK
jgi:hypothetical protein